MSETMKKLAAAYAAEVIKNRRYLHAHPELSFHETNTAQWIRDHLAAIGIPTLSGITGNSTVGVLKGTQPGPSIGFRADIDALGLTEMNDLPYKSTHPGIMHACGHDAHTAVLMAMAEIFASHRELVHGTIYFVFQQGEEFLPGGAQQLVKDGIMDRIDYMFAWHAAALEKVGTVDVAAGVREAAVGTYDIKITGKGGHGGFPQSVIFCGQFIHAILFCSLLLRLLSFDFSLRIFLAQAGQYLDAPEPGTYSTPHTVQFLAGIAAHRFVGMICNSSTKPMNL